MKTSPRTNAYHCKFIRSSAIDPGGFFFFGGSVGGGGGAVVARDMMRRVPGALY